MLLALLLSAADPQTAVDAERAFARAAQTDGQWTAFLAYADDEAVMFTPQPVNAQDYLAARQDPPKAVEWWPAESYVSCDGKFAVNTGPWQRDDASGYFTTVWQRQTDGSWKWLVDAGDALATPRKRPKRVKTRRASCNPVPAQQRPEPVWTGAEASDTSIDGTLTWRWTVAADGARTFEAKLWNGSGYEPVIADSVAAPAPE